MMLSTNIDYISTIFKTFDSDIDKWTSKIGVFGRSFNQIGTAVTNKLIDFNDEFERTGKIASSWKNTDSIWKRLYGNKNELDWRRNSMGEIVTKDNIDSYIAKISQSDANTLAKSIYDESDAVAAGTRSWEGYFNKLNNTNIGYVVDLIKNTDDLSKLTGDDLVQANKNARQAAIAHNTALKQQTLGAKAASVAMKGLALVGNVLLTMAITKGVEWLLTYNQRLEESRQEMIEAGKEASKLTKDLDGLVEQYRKLGEDGNLDNSDREQARNIQEQINSLLGDEVHYINLSNGSYEHQLELLRKIQHEKANENYSTITDAKNAADESLRSKGVGTVGAGFNEKINGEWETDAIKKLLYKEGFSEYIDETLGGFNVGNYYNNSAEDFIKSYNDMIELRTKLSKSYSDEFKEGGKLHDFYKNLDQKIKDMTDAVQNYKDAIKSYDLNEAVIQFNEVDFGGVKGALIDTKEEMESWAKAMVESDDISDGIKENLIELAKTYYPELSDAINESVQAHYKEKYAKAGSSSEIENHIKNLDAEADQCGLTKKAYIELISQEILFNNNNLNVTQKISALQQLAYQAGITADKMRQALMFDSLQKAYDVETHGIEAAYRAGRITKEQRDARKAQILSELNSSLYEGYEDSPGGDTPPYTPSGGSGGGGKGSSSGSDNKPDYEDPTDAIIDRINLRHRELEQQEEYIENAREIAELENDYEKQISLTNDLIATRKKRIDELNTANAGLHNEAEYLRNSNPWDEASWFDSQGNATESYYKDFNGAATKEEQKNIKNLFESILKYKEAYIKNAEEIVDINKEILQDEEDVWNVRRNIFDDRLEESERYIEKSNELGWENGDNELAARKRVLDWIQSDYYRSLIKDDEEYYKILEEHRISYHKLAVDSIKNALQQAYDDFEERMEKRRKALDFEKEQLSSLSTLLGKHHEVLNSIDEEQHNITKELETSKTMTQYLDEETRKLLFNQADYNALSEELVYLKEKANSLQEKYQRDIANATLENVAEITSNYERQYDIMLKQYEIAKAELEVAKKRQQLDNVLAEKNVKMLINGRWQWVANTQDVINAQNELADAEYNVTKAQSGLDQTTEQHKLQSMINSLETTGNEMDAMLERRKNRLDSILESFEQKPGELSDILAEISVSGVTTISEVCGKVSGALGDLYRSLTGKDANVGSSSGRPIEYFKYTTKTFDNDGVKFDLYYDSTGKLTGVSDIKRYASGTKSALRGLAEIGEEGSEFLAKNGHLIPINQPTLANLSGGEMVFNHGQMDNLWKISAFDPSRLLIRNPQGNIDNSNCNNINIGDLRLDATSGIGKELADVLYRIKNMR